MADTRKGWSEVVTPDDLDAHMLATEQAQANASLVTTFIEEARLPRSSRIYVPGAGTGQLFELIETCTFSGFDFLFTDLRAEFLARIERRIPREVYFRTQVDDVEDSWIDTKVDVVLIVLLLEHVDWRLALNEILETQPEQLWIIIQRNDITGSTAVTTKRELRPSIREFAKVAKSELLGSATLEVELMARGFKLASRSERIVPDAKAMVGLRFIRR